MIFGLFRSFFMCDYFYNRTKFCVIIFQITQDLVKIASYGEIMKITTPNFVYDISNHTTRWRNFLRKFLARRVIWNIVHEIWWRYLTLFVNLKHPFDHRVEIKTVIENMSSKICHTRGSGVKKYVHFYCPDPLWNLW